MENINQRGSAIVQTPRVFLITKRHLKKEFPDFFVNEDSTYFCIINNCLHAFHVYGNKCHEYETETDQVLKDLCPLKVHSIVILHIEHVQNEYADMYIYWTTSSLRDPNDVNQYSNRAKLDGQYFDDFGKWLETNAAAVNVHKIFRRL